MRHNRAVVKKRFFLKIRFFLLNRRGWFGHGMHDRLDRLEEKVCSPPDTPQILSCLFFLSWLTTMSLPLSLWHQVVGIDILYPIKADYPFTVRIHIHDQPLIYQFTVFIIPDAFDGPNKTF
jgi:hypothetical protein